MEWVASSRKDLKKFPDRVQDRVGYALFQAQLGLKHPDAKPLAGKGSAVMEVVSRYEKDTFRAVYTVKFAEATYVLHAFQKKAKKGIATPSADLALVEQRLKIAQRHYFGGIGVLGFWRLGQLGSDLGQDL